MEATATYTVEKTLREVMLDRLNELHMTKAEAAMRISVLQAMAA